MRFPLSEYPPMHPVLDLFLHRPKFVFNVQPYFITPSPHPYLGGRF